MALPHISFFEYIQFLLLVKKDKRNMVGRLMHKFRKFWILSELCSEVFDFIINLEGIDIPNFYFGIRFSYVES